MYIRENWRQTSDFLTVHFSNGWLTRRRRCQIDKRYSLGSEEKFEQCLKPTVYQYSKLRIKKSLHKNALKRACLVFKVHKTKYAEKFS